jgi:transcriptional regulator with XRE-family HTH domain
MEFRYWLDAFMRKGGWTQASLGKALGVAQVTVGAWVNGKNLPDARNLRKISELAGEDPIWLFRQVGYLPPETEGAEARSSPVVTPRSLELLNLFNRLPEGEQDLEVEVLRLRLRHLERSGSPPAPAAQDNGDGMDDLTVESMREPEPSIEVGDN